VTTEHPKQHQHDEHGLSVAEKRAIVGLFRAGHSASHLADLYDVPLEVVRVIVRTANPKLQVHKGGF
jgi:hypothetical protein